MPLSRRCSALSIAFLAIACLPASAQIPCSAHAIQSAASTVSDTQHQLAAVKIEEMDTDVSPSLQQATTLLKQSLDNAAQAILACEPTDATPATLQSAFAKALNANAPEPDNASFPWGANLRVTVQSTSIPHLLEVQLQYAIECGDDTMLLLVSPQQDHWSEKLLWQSPVYKDDSGAFGDFFLTAYLPGPSPADWRVVAAHGKPWCTSRMSSFSIDVLAPTSNPAQPTRIWHTDRDYSRGDLLPRLKASGNVFELRLLEDEMIFDPDDGFERTVVYRYRLSNDKVTRLEPVATNGRGFVEEWLSMPWSEAAEQSLPTSSASLQPIHRLYETSYPKDSNAYTTWTAGPVRACSTPIHFQVAFDTQLNRIVPGKPGGELDAPIRTYFQIQQVSNGYQMESASKHPDPTCTGRNLMAKPAAKPR